MKLKIDNYHMIIIPEFFDRRAGGLMVWFFVVFKAGGPGYYDGLDKQCFFC